ncbi:vp91 [Fopius arisanus]|uniref:ORF75 protein n=1 Tax=Fopius arisanus TaxID=64838 RepID=A0A0C9RSI7_9HYME|nr:vp91 [Fopius arisanus]
MDLVLGILIAFLGLILCCILIFNHIGTTGDEEVLAKKILLAKPSAQSFCMGYDKVSGKYKNITMDRGKVKINNETKPVDFSLIRTSFAELGKIKWQSNGFKIVGFKNVTFYCPDGYEGENCNLKPLCQHTDDGKFKALTFTNFNGLALYKNNFHIKQLRRRRSKRAGHSKHPRIRIHCMKDGNYELEACPTNKILGEDLNCHSYDICEEKNNGFRHKSPIEDNDTKLELTSYYECYNGESKVKYCPPYTQYNELNNACVAVSSCEENGTLPIEGNNNQYIYCKNKMAKVIDCDQGVIKISDTEYACKIFECKEQDLESTTEYLKYKYGKITCVDDKHIVTECNRNLTLWKAPVSWKWWKQVNFQIDQYPQEFMDNNGQCLPVNRLRDVLREDLIINLAWTDAMPRAYPFNLITNTYIPSLTNSAYHPLIVEKHSENSEKIADDSRKIYCWNYIEGRVEPEPPEGKTIDWGCPCSDKLLDRYDFPWKTLQTMIRPAGSSLPPKPGLPPILIGVPVDYNPDVSFWPFFNEIEETYHVNNLKIYEQSRAIHLITFTSKYPPPGFIEKNIAIQYGFEENSNNLTSNNRLKNSRLYLSGYGIIDENDANNYQWYTIGSGKCMPIEIPDEDLIYNEENEKWDSINVDVTRVVKEIVLCPEEINTKKSGTYGILWSKVHEITSKTDMDYELVDGLGLHGVKGFRMNGQYAPPTLQFLIVKQNGNYATISYGSLVHVLDNECYPILKLP